MSNLGIVAVSDQLDEEISVLAGGSFFIFAAAGCTIYAFARGRYVTKQYKGHNSPVHCLLDLGSSGTFVSADIEGCVRIWNVETTEVVYKLEFSPDTFAVTCMMHPPGYTNKLLFGSRQGTLQLWNIKSNSQVFAFDSLEAPITCLQQVPAEDVIAMGLANGRVFIRNLRYDKTLMSIEQDGGPVTSISFRTDNQSDLIMVTGNTSGHINLWQLKEKRCSGEVRSAHNGSLAGLFCVPGHPYMVTNGPDNALKVWTFDRSDGRPQVLHSRMGHWKPPSCLRYWKTTGGANVVSAGQDSTIRIFSTLHDKWNRSLGRAYKPGHSRKTAKRSGFPEHLVLPPVTGLVCEGARDGDWDTVAAGHGGGCRGVTSWNYSKGCRGKHWLDPSRFRDREDRFKSVAVQCLDITSCGNFVVIGYSSGHVIKFNMQSAIERGHYGNEIAHECSVSGLAVNSVNQILLTTGEKTVKFWNFKTHKLLGERHFESAILFVRFHRESDTAAFAMAGGSIVLIDSVNRHTIRHFAGHKEPLNDLCFSCDGKWLLSTAQDCLIKTWDVVDAKLIDMFRVPKPVTSMVLSPTGDFLSTCHSSLLGVYLWANRALYRHLLLSPIDTNAATPTAISLPTSRLRRPSEGDADEEDEASSAEAAVVVYQSPRQLQDELMTLSPLPASYWTTLLKLETIRMRNRATEAPIEGKAAPFFLPVVETESGLALLPLDGGDDEAGGPNKAKRARVMTSNDLSAEKDVVLPALSSLAPLLDKAVSSTKDYTACLAHLLTLGPSALDLEVDQLALCPPLLPAFLSMLSAGLEAHTHIDQIQSLLALFIRHHRAEVLLQCPALRGQLTQLVDRMGELSAKMTGRLVRTSAMLNFAKNLPYAV